MVGGVGGRLAQIVDTELVCDVFFFDGIAKGTPEIIEDERESCLILVSKVVLFQYYIKVSSRILVIFTFYLPYFLVLKLHQVLTNRSFRLRFVEVCYLVISIIAILVIYYLNVKIDEESEGSLLERKDLFYLIFNGLINCLYFFFFTRFRKLQAAKYVVQVHARRTPACSL